MSCNRCNRSSCSGCGPVPYYQNIEMCPEDNCERIYQQQFYFSMQVQNSWNIPQVGGSAILNIPGLKNAEVGTYLHNPNYGYFEIISVDVCNQQIVVQNNGDTTNQPVGTQIPECTGFILTDARCCEGGSGGSDCLNAVAVDFTAPVEDVPLTITVTSASGLSVGKTVQIGAGRYELTEVTSDTTIIITNVGDGITPGTPVIARDSAGNFQYCVVQLDQNPCTNESVTEGTLMVCSDGIMVPLCGSVAGSTPVLIDPENCTVQFQPSNFPPRVCTNLTADLTLFNGVTGPYTMVVSDISDFDVGDILQIGEREDRFIISGFSGGNFVDGDLDTAPPANEVIPAGTSVCTVTCCEELESRVDVIEEEIPCLPQNKVSVISLQQFAVPVSFGGDQTFANTVSTNIVQITTPNDCPDALYLVKATVAVLALPDHDTGVIMHEIECVWDNGLAGNRASGKTVWTDDGTSDGFDVAEAYPADVDGGVWGQLENGTPLWTMMYHQADVCAHSSGVAPNTTLQLELHYKSLIGDNNPPSIINGINIQVFGIVEVMRMI